MKKFKEFLFMFIPYCVLGIISFCDFSFQYYDFDILMTLDIITDGFFIIALFYTVIPAGLVALLLTIIFSLIIKRKKELIGRRKYYIFLFLIALIAPVVIILILTRTFDLLLNSIYAIQVAITVVFIHWVAEWISEKIKSTRKGNCQ